MFKIKFHIVFSERIDSGNARVVFLFPNCSKDMVHHTKIFFVCRIIFRNINGFCDGTEIFYENLCNFPVMRHNLILLE